jgi:YidC/Oxa1 family membrane protein insertase
VQPNPNDRPFDRRTLLAFVLMGVVWIGWFAIFPPAQNTEPTAGSMAAADTSAVDLTRPALRADEDRPRLEPGSASIGRTTADGDGSLRSGTSSEWVDPADTDRGSVVRVSTPRFEAEIDRVGGDIVSWRLRRYQDTAGRAVELVGPRTTDRGSQHAHALRVVLEDQILDLRRVRFQVDRESIALAAEDAPVDLVLHADRADGGRVELVYTFDPERYGFDVVARVQPGSSQRLPVSLEVAWPGGIASTEPDSVTEYQEVRSVARVGEEIHKIKYGDLAKGDGSKGRRAYEGTVSWAGVQGKYFLSALVEEQPQRGTVRLGGDGRLGVQTFEAEVAMLGRAPAEARYTVFMGPVDYDILAVYDREPYNAKLTALVDLGPSIFRPIATATLWGLRQLHHVVPNWGWTIVLFSIFTKLLFWPLTKSSTESMKKMQEMQPKMKKLQQKYKEDPQRQSQEMMKLYKEHGVNPLNMGGCLPLLLQMPVFFALFTILRKTIDLRQAEFIWWIDDLSSPDVLFLLPFSVPFFGSNFSLLPFLMSISMWAQMKFQQPANAAQPDNPMAQQLKMMSTLMPVMMFVFFYNSPSGLVLYWLVNTLLTAFQTWRIHSKATPAPAPAA